MSDVFDDTVFDEQIVSDLDEPEDGRDGQPYDGSSDSPETMSGLDPLRKHNYLLDDDLQVVDDLDQGAEAQDEDLHEWEDDDAEDDGEDREDD